MLFLDQSPADCISNKSRIRISRVRLVGEIGRNYSGVKNLPSGPSAGVDRFVAFEPNVCASLAMQRLDITTDAARRRTGGSDKRAGETEAGGGLSIN